MSREFLKTVDQVAQEEHRSRSELIREALRAYFAKRMSRFTEIPSAVGEISTKSLVQGKKRSLGLAEIESKLCTFFEQDKDIRLAYLFGSYATGRTGPLSDIDIAVLLDKSIPPTNYSDKLLELINNFSGLLKTNNLDVVILNRAPSGLQYQIAKEGKVVFCRGEDMRIDYECNVLNSYLDFKPCEDNYIASLARKIKKGELIAK